MIVWLCNRRVFKSRHTFGVSRARTVSRNRSSAVRLFSVLKSANANRKQQRGRSKIATRNSQIWWPDWARTSDPYQYHARVRVGGRLYRRALGTNDYQLARRKLSDFKRELGRTDARVSKTSFGAVLDKYAQTIGGLSASSQKDKRAIISKLKSTWLAIDALPLRVIKPSDCAAWLSRHCGDKGASYYNSVLTVVRNALELAVRDRIIADSPAAHLKYRKRNKPIRLTPSFEQFQQIVADIRGQRLNREAEQSADFVELLGLAGLGQAEARTLRE